jgi:hypothetical protein
MGLRVDEPYQRIYSSGIQSRAQGMSESRDTICVLALHTCSAIFKVQVKLKMLRGQEVVVKGMPLFDSVLSGYHKGYASITQAYYVGEKKD